MGSVWDRLLDTTCFNDYETKIIKREDFDDIVISNKLNRLNNGCYIRITPYISFKIKNFIYNGHSYKFIKKILLLEDKYGELKISIVKPEVGKSYNIKYEHIKLVLNYVLIKDLANIILEYLDKPYFYHKV